MDCEVATHMDWTYKMSFGKDFAYVDFFLNVILLRNNTIIFLVCFKWILQYIPCSPMDPLQWMGTIKMGVQIADKNTSILMNS